MIISRIILKNWKNFRNVDVNLGRRTFLVGPNASGKSNFLDVFRFLRDIAKSTGGGLEKAIKDRGGISKIRCLAARRQSHIEIEVHLSEVLSEQPTWKYSIKIGQLPRGFRKPILIHEKVWKGSELILNRPNDDDTKDVLLLTQTHLEQLNANAKFREIVRFFESINYLHLVPQLLRHPEAFVGPAIVDDPFGRNFLERVAETPERTRKVRLRKIENALQKAVPQLNQLTDTKDIRGVPHLEAIYSHWRPKGARQSEEQFSDGTLRLIGFLWSLLESDSLLLLEEPELSLHTGVIRELPSLIWRLKTKRKQQIIISTHSSELLSDTQIDGQEVILLSPNVEGTEMVRAADIDEVRLLLEGGLSIADAVIPRTEPEDIKDIGQLDFDL